MNFSNGTGNGESETGTFDGAAMSRSAIKLLKDVFAIGGRNSATLILDSNEYALTGGRGVDLNRGTGFGVFPGIVEDLHQHLLQQKRITLNRGQAGGEIDGQVAPTEIA